MKTIATILILAAALMTAGCQKQCDTHLQQMANSDVCDDAINSARLKQQTANQEVINRLDDKLTCTKLKGDLLKAGDSPEQIKHQLAESGFNLDCSVKGSQ